MANMSNAAMIAAVTKAMPNMTNEASKQVASDWIKNPGKMFADQSQFSTSFLNTSLTWILDQIRIQDFYNIYEEMDIVRRSTQEFGQIQRMYMPKINSVDADFQKTWVNGTSSDMFKKRLIQPTQKFALRNVSYNNRVSVPADYFLTSSFLSSGGIIDYNTALVQSMEVAYNRFRFALTRDLIARQTASADLKDSQKLSISIANPLAITTEEARSIVKQFLDLESLARIQSGAFNEMGYDYTWEPSNIRILARIGFKSAMSLALIDVFNPQIIQNFLDRIVEVPTLGEVNYYTDSTMSTPLYPVYNADGMVIGLNSTQGATEVTVSFEDAFASETEEGKKITMIVLDNYRMNWITSSYNELRMEYTIYNIEGDYRNLYAKVQGNPEAGTGAAFFADTSYNFVEFINDYTPPAE